MLFCGTAVNQSSCVTEVMSQNEYLKPALCCAEGQIFSQRVKDAGQTKLKLLCSLLTVDMQNNLKQEALRKGGTLMGANG